MGPILPQKGALYTFHCHDIWFYSSECAHEIYLTVLSPEEIVFYYMCFYHISFLAIGNQDMFKNNLILSFTFNGSFNVNNLSKNTEQYRNLFQSNWKNIHWCQ